MTDLKEHSTFPGTTRNHGAGPRLDQRKSHAAQAPRRHAPVLPRSNRGQNLAALALKGLPGDDADAVVGQNMSEHVKLNTAQGSTGAYERKVFTPCHACRILQHSTMISASYQGFERFDRLTHTCITPCLALHSQVLKTPNSTASISELPPALTWTHSPSMSLGLLRSRQMQDKEFNLLSLSRTKALK